MIVPGKSCWFNKPVAERIMRFMNERGLIRCSSCMGERAERSELRNFQQYRGGSYSIVFSTQEQVCSSTPSIA